MQASKSTGAVFNGEKLGLQRWSQQWGAGVPVWHKKNEFICLGLCVHLGERARSSCMCLQLQPVWEQVFDV